MIALGARVGGQFEAVRDNGSEIASEPRNDGSERSGPRIARPSRSATVIELVGDVGVGKTTFVRGLAKGLGVREPVTSPSFTISKSYAFGDGQTLTHYDFYRLPEPGQMAEDLEEKLAEDNNIIVVEWGDSVADVLPAERTKITIYYNDDGTREAKIENLS